MKKLLPLLVILVFASCKKGYQTTQYFTNGDFTAIADEGSSHVTLINNTSRSVLIYNVNANADYFIYGDSANRHVYYYANFIQRAIWPNYLYELHGRDTLNIPNDSLLFGNIHFSNSINNTVILCFTLWDKEEFIYDGHGEYDSAGYTAIYEPSFTTCNQ